MRTKTMLIGGAATAAVVALLAWAFAPRPLEVETAEASRGPFELVIVEDGRTRLVDRFVVAAPVAGRLQRIELRAGDTLAAGDVVATITATPAPMIDARSRGQLAAQVDAAGAQVRRAGAGVESARVALMQAEAERRRSEQLVGQGFVAAAKVETDRLAQQAAERAVDAAIQARRVAEQELAMARAALTVSQPGDQGLRRLPVTAPAPGRVLRVLQASETAVMAGTPLVEIGDTSRLEVVVELLTTDALRAVPGSAVRIERWGGEGVLDGRVRAVEPGGFTKVSALGVEEQRVNALIDITSPRERWQALGDGYRVGVRIVTLAEPDVLRVPVSAVFPRPARDGEGGEGAAAGPQRDAVFVVDGARARLAPVAVPARNSVHAWIRDGLQAGQQVIVYPPPDVVDGARVRARPE